MAEDAADPESRKDLPKIEKPVGTEQRWPAFSVGKNLDAKVREAHNPQRRKICVVKAG